MRVAAQHRLEEGWAGAQDDPVGRQLLILTGQRDVEELLLFANVPKCRADVPLKVVPLEAELFRRHGVGSAVLSVSSPEKIWISPQQLQRLGRSHFKQLVTWTIEVSYFFLCHSLTNLSEILNSPAKPHLKQIKCIIIYENKYLCNAVLWIRFWLNPELFLDPELLFRIRIQTKIK